jgi:hypothetical protein
MSDVNIMFDLRVMQMADGTWSLSLIEPDNDYSWRHWPDSLNQANDSWKGETLVDVMAEATASLSVALDDGDPPLADVS